MPEPVIHTCTCSSCAAQDSDATQALHHQINLFLSRSGEQLVAQIMWDLNGKTIRRGRREFDL